MELKVGLMLVRCHCVPKWPWNRIVDVSDRSKLLNTCI